MNKNKLFPLATLILLFFAVVIAIVSRNPDQNANNQNTDNSLPENKQVRTNNASDDQAADGQNTAGTNNVDFSAALDDFEKTLNDNDAEDLSNDSLEDIGTGLGSF